VGVAIACLKNPRGRVDALCAVRERVPYARVLLCAYGLDEGQESHDGIRGHAFLSLACSLCALCAARGHTRLDLPCLTVVTASSEMPSYARNGPRTTRISVDDTRPLRGSWALMAAKRSAACPVMPTASRSGRSSSVDSAESSSELS
jgi:hypothetical protein